MAKIQNPIALRLAASLRMKLRRTKELNRKVLVIRHYDYGFLQEYQFSPSDTPPLFRYYQFSKGSKSKNIMKKIWGRSMYPVWFKCSSCLRAGGGGDRDVLDVGLSAAAAAVGDGAAVGEKLLEPSADEDYDDESVDQRAERFIERFYEEMRMQRQESASSQLNELFPIDAR